MTNTREDIYKDIKIEPNKDMLSQRAKNISIQEYLSEHKRSIEDPEFWAEKARENLIWFEDFTSTYSRKDESYTWFEGGKINITYNCLDRHVEAGKGDVVAYYYVDEDGSEISITYAELLTKVKKFANGLINLGIKKGDTVTLYMHHGIELMVSMLGCARIGAIHSVVFGGYGVEALRTRIEAAKSELVITSSYTKKKGKKIYFKQTVDDAIEGFDFVKNVLFLRRDGDEELKQKDSDWNMLLDMSSENHTAVGFDSETPLFILYTSGSTGAPKGVIHTTGGYSIYTHETAKLSFDLDNEDVFWCTADCGWITGHTYVVYGMLSNLTTSILYEGAATYPDVSRWWQIIEKYKVSKFYTAPTAIRMLMKNGDEPVKKYDLSSLKIIGSVGEPLNPKAWHWYKEVVGSNKAIVIDTWWQTETGGHMLCTPPFLPQKPGRAGLPLFGIEPAVVDENGKEVAAGTQGNLIIKKPWPGALRDCFGNHERYKQYWNTYKNYFDSGDLAIEDEDGYILVLGRSDDVIKVAGHRIGSAEVESALVKHSIVSEAAVIGIPDDIKGNKIVAFVIPMNNYNSESEDTISILKEHVTNTVGKFAIPEEIRIVDSLPKTRSGKIMRRVLRAEAMGEDAGDTSTMAD